MREGRGKLFLLCVPRPLVQSKYHGQDLARLERNRPHTGMGIRAEVPRRIEGQALQASRTAASGRGREGPLTRREGKCL